MREQMWPYAWPFIFIFIALASAKAFAATPPQPSTNVVPFDVAYSRLVDRDLDLKTRALDVDSARAKRLRQVGTFLPSLSAQISETRVGEPAVDARRSGALVASANLFSSGTDFAGAKAAGRDVAASEESFAAQRRKAEESAITTIVSYVASRRRKEIIEKIVNLRSDSMRVAKERYAKGILPQQEVDKVAIDLDNTRARLIDAEAEETAARATMRAALGTSDDVSIEWPWKTALTSRNDIEDRTFSIQSLPSYRATVESVEAESWRLHQARGALLPSLDVSASYGNQDLSQPDRRDWTASVTLSILLFEKFQGWTATSLQRQAYEAAVIRREAIIRTAHADAESLKGSFRAARESALARERTAKTAERLYNDNQQRFRLGRASVNDLAIDQDRLLESQLLEIEGWSTAHRSLARLCHALGGLVAANGSCTP